MHGNFPFSVSCLAITKQAKQRVYSSPTESGAKCMPRRQPNHEESAADRQLLLAFFTATGQFYPALVLEDTVIKLLGFTPAGVQAAAKLGFLVPAHEGRFKMKQYPLIDVVKMIFNKPALMKAARSGVRLVMGMVQLGSALAVPGNHDIKFMRAIWGKKVQVTHGLAESLQQFEAYEEHYRGFSRIAADFMDELVSHYVFDDGKLVVAHAGMKETMQWRGSGKVREFALYGETTGETDEFGLPVRYPWAQEYRGLAMVVYGHITLQSGRVAASSGKSTIELGLAKRPAESPFSK
jgi:hypothetical protein